MAKGDWGKSSNTVKKKSRRGGYKHSRAEIGCTQSEELHINTGSSPMIREREEKLTETKNTEGNDG